MQAVEKYSVWVAETIIRLVGSAAKEVEMLEGISASMKEKAESSGLYTAEEVKEMLAPTKKKLDLSVERFAALKQWLVHSPNDQVTKQHNK